MNDDPANLAIPGMTPSRRRSTHCLSDRALDALLLGELDGPTKGSAEAHLAACVACESALSSMRKDLATFAAQPQFARTMQALGAHANPPKTALWASLWPRRLSWVTGLAAAAAALVFALPATKENRVKGGFSLSTFVQKRGATQGTLWMQETVSPGDKIQFQVTSHTTGYLAILSVDETSAVSIYYPPGPVAVPIGVGSNQPLQTAVALDDVLGKETVIGLRCPNAEKTADLVAAAQRAVAAAQKTGQPGFTVGPLGTGCVEFRLTFTKAP